MVAQDDIVVAVSSVLGLDKLSQLVSKCEADGHNFQLAKLQALTAMCTLHEQGQAQALEMGRKALAVLGELGEEQPPSAERENEERLELTLMNRVLLAGSPADWQYLPRLAYLTNSTSTDKIPVEQTFAYYYSANPSALAGDLEGFAETFLPFPEKASDVARTHPDEGTRVFVLQVLCTCAMYEVSLKYNKKFDWARLFGKHGELLVQTCHECKYDTHMT